MSQPPPVARASSTPEYLGIYDFLAAQAQRIPNALALLAPGRAPLHIRPPPSARGGGGAEIACHGCEPAGPRCACVAQWSRDGSGFSCGGHRAACVPLNPAYSVHEFDTYLAQLDPKVLIVHRQDSPVRAVHARDLCIVELSVMAEMAAGLFTLTGDEQLHATSPAYAHPNDVALLLSTSGTRLPAQNRAADACQPLSVGIL